MASPPNYNILSQSYKIKNPFANGRSTWGRHFIKLSAMKYKYHYILWFLPWIIYPISQLTVYYKMSIPAPQLHFFCYITRWVFVSGRKSTDRCVVFGEGWVRGRREAGSYCWGLCLELCSLLSVQYMGTLWGDKYIVWLVSLQICYPLLRAGLVV